MGPEELTTLLWREREMLDMLVFKLDVENLILASGRSRWLDHATREVEHIMNRLRATTLERTAAAAVLATSWGLPEEASLQELAAAAPGGPWGDILLDHFTALTSLVDRVRALRDTNMQFLRAGLVSAQETAAGHAQDAGTYDILGNTHQGAAARFLDESV